MARCQIKNIVLSILLFLSLSVSNGQLITNNVLLGVGAGTSYPNAVMSWDVDPINRFIDLHLNRRAYSASDDAGVKDTDLDVSFTGGTISGVAIDSVDRIDGDDLVGGEFDIRVYISLTGSASGAEIVTIQPSSSIAIISDDGTKFPVSANTVNVNINPTYDSDYSNGLEFAIDQGIAVPAREFRVVENAFFVSYKATGRFSEVDIMVPFFFSSPSESYCLLDWKRLTFLTKVVTSSFAYTYGSGYPATGGYFQTGWVPTVETVLGSNFQLTDAGIFHDSQTDISSSTISDYGSQNTDLTNSTVRAISRNGTVAAFNLNSGSANTAGTMTTSVHRYVNTRDGALNTNHDVYIDGSLFDGSNAASIGLSNQQILVHGYWAGNGTITASTRKIGAFFLGEGYVDATQVANEDTAWTSYKTNIAAVTTTQDILMDNDEPLETDDNDQLKTD